MSPIFSQFIEENRKDAFLMDVYPLIKSWENIDGFTAAHNGTGAFTVGWPRATMTTGATSGSRVLVYSSVQSMSKTNPRFYTRFRLRVAPSGDFTSTFAMFGMHSAPTAPILAGAHIAFRITNGLIYAGCGDGTNGQEVSTGITLASGILTDLYWKQIGGNIDFYVDGALKVTFNTLVPDGIAIPFMFYLSNSAAADKQFLLFPVMIGRGEP